MLNQELAFDVATQGYCLPLQFTGSSRSSEVEERIVRHLYALLARALSTSYSRPSALRMWYEIDTSSVQPRLEPTTPASLVRAWTVAALLGPYPDQDYDVVLTMPSPTRQKVLVQFKSPTRATPSIIAPQES